MKPNFFALKNNISWLAAFFVFVVFIIATNSYLKNKKDVWEKDVRSNLKEILIGKKSRLEKALYSRIYYTRGIAAHVSYNPDISNPEYYELAREFIGPDSVINSMALSKNCVLNAIYPLLGHEDALGLNLLDHPDRKEIVEKTIETKKTFVAGPVELVEGGVAFISYTPIFDKTQSPEAFWGMTDIVIKRDAYLQSAGLLELENSLKFSLKGIDGKGEMGEVFFGDGGIFEKDPVLVDINLPYGHWVLGAIPVNGWNAYINQDDILKKALYLVSFLLSILVWFLLRSEHRLRKNAKEQQAILKSLDNSIIEYDNDGRYVKIASTNRGMLIKDPKELIGKTVFDIFDQNKAQLLHDGICNCLKKKELIVLDYSLVIDGAERWFQGRFSYKSEKRVICSAYDITSNKIYQQELKQSNDMKDKLFSIIAHDLRNPVGTNNELVSQLVKNYEVFSEEEKKKILRSLQKSGENTWVLLENLLNWSKAQKGMLKAEQNVIDIRHISENAIDLMSESFTQKKLKLSVDFEEVGNVYGDARITGTIIRNLLSNAVKFTKLDGTIEVKTKRDKSNKHLILSVKDNGIGMNSDQIESVFTLGKTKTRLGTNNESGSGLGLALCKELIEIQGGRICVTSEEGKGSIFYITLPLA